MTTSKGFNDEIKSLLAEPIQGVAAGDLGPAVLTAQGKNLDSPLRCYASTPPDAFLNFSASVTAMGDGGFKQVPPISSIGVPLVPASKINMGTGVVTGGTFQISGVAFATAFAALTKTNNQWRRFVFALQASGIVSVAVSAEASSQAGLSDWGILAASLGGLGVTYVDVKWISASTQYQTPAGTLTIENSGIYRLPLGSGGSGTGNGNTVLETLKNTLDATSPYTSCMPNTILADGVTKFATLTGAALDLTTNTIKFTANSQQVVSTQSLDAYYLANSPSDISVIDLEAFWSYGSTTSAFSIPTGFTYEVSRDGGQNYFPVSMTQIPGTNTFYGTLSFGGTTTTESSFVALASQNSTGGTLTLNTTTNQQIAQAFTLAAAAKALTVSLNIAKTGSPTGFIYVSLVANNAGVPSLLGTDILAQSFAISIASLTTGVNAITIPGTVLPAGTYHIVVSTDAAYKAVYSAGVTQLTLNALSSGAASPFATVYNGTTYSATALDLAYIVTGRALDLRVRITSAGSPTYPVGLDGYGIFYGYQDQGFASAKKKLTSRVFNSVTDNTSTFTITEFALDPDLLKIYLQGSGQVWARGDFQVNGQTVTFPANFFNMGGVNQLVTLLFDQNTGGSFDGADSNARLLAANHLGSTAAADDRSTAGRGPIVRSTAGTLFETSVGSDGLPIQLNATSGVTVLKIVPELRNALINGGFDIWQRGTSGGTGGYVADRYQSLVTGGSSGTLSQSTDVPTQAQSGFQSLYSLKYTVTSGAATGAAQFALLSTKLEGLNYAPLHGNPARRQIWVKSSIAGTYSAAFQNAAGTRCYVAPLVVNSANTWEAKVFDFTCDTQGTWAFDNSVGMHVRIGLSVGSSSQTSTLNAWQAGNFFGVTGQTDLVATTGATFLIAQDALYPVQAGSGVVLPFTRTGRTYQQELAACQRYCFIPDWEQAAAGYIGNGHCLGTTSGIVTVPFPVPMRALPTITQSGNISVITATGASAGNVTLGTSAMGNQFAALSFSGASGLVAGNSTLLYKVSASSVLQFIAEL